LVPPNGPQTGSAGAGTTPAGRSKLEKFWAAAKVLQDVQSSETEAETLIKPQVSTP